MNNQEINKCIAEIENLYVTDELICVGEAVPVCESGKGPWENYDPVNEWSDAGPIIERYGVIFDIEYHPAMSTAYTLAKVKDSGVDWVAVEQKDSNRYYRKAALLAIIEAHDKGR